MKTVAAVMLSLFPAAALAAAPVRGADAPEKAADKQDKIVCKTYAEIGSLIATQRVCHTKREWETLPKGTRPDPARWEEASATDRRARFPAGRRSVRLLFFPKAQREPGGWSGSWEARPTYSPQAHPKCVSSCWWCA